jgi:GNAT superfamily N-acetyltransferase
MAAEYRIRRIARRDPAECLAVMRLHLRLFGSSADVPMPSENYWWGVFAKGRVVGFAGLQVSIRVPNGGYLVRAGVAPSHRGFGLQRELIRVRERSARRRGWTVLHSDTIDNPHSSRNLEACGFEPFTLEHPWGNKGAIYWRKFL